MLESYDSPIALRSNGNQALRCSHSCLILFGVVNCSMFLDQDKTEAFGHRHFNGTEDLFCI